MPKGHVVVAKYIYDSMTPECKVSFDDFINRGKVIDITDDRSEYDYFVDHPDFDSKMYGEGAKYVLHVRKIMDDWHNPSYVISKLSVWASDMRVHHIKDYMRPEGVKYE